MTFSAFVEQEQVVPLLRRRGIFRAACEGRTLRDHLGLSVLPARHAPAQAA